MEYFRQKFAREDLGGESVLRLHPIFCWHIGARQCDLKFIEEAIREIKEDPAARWFYGGDGGECVTKFSKGSVYEQTLSPQAQQDFLRYLLSPIKEKGLFGIRGNHGNRIDKETGLGFDKTLLTSLGIPYLGISALVNLVVVRSSYDIYTHHGVDSAVSLQGKVNAAQKHNFVLADARITGHSHAAMDLQPMVYRVANNGEKRIDTLQCAQFIAGAAYDSTVEGYAEAKAYGPMLPGRVVVELSGVIRTGVAAKQITGKVIRSTGLYDTDQERRKRQTRWEEEYEVR